MKQNTKFIWIYGAILFSFALILIVFAGLTQTSSDKELNKVQKETAGIRKSLTDLTKENSRLTAKVSETEKENKALKETNTQLTLEKEMALSAYGGDVEITRTLVDAYTLLLADKKDEAIQKIENINEFSLTEAQKHVYDTIIGE